jgi:hypothetical protein
MIGLAGLGIESGPLSVQEESADPALLNETVQVAIHGGETDPTQSFVSSPVDLMGERMGVIALESFEHLHELTCCACAGRSPHRLPLPRIRAIGRTERQLSAEYQIAGRLSTASQQPLAISDGEALSREQA